MEVSCTKTSVLFAEWEIRGLKKKINKRWFKPLITKTLITVRWQLNHLIDLKSPKPPEVTNEQWNTLVSSRGTDAEKKKSEHMRSILKGKGSKAAQLKAIEKATIVKLVRL